jgi:peptide/nickel transport system substrate-binding protein
MRSMRFRELAASATRHLLPVALLATLAACPRKAPPERDKSLVVHAENEPVHLVSMIQPDGWAHRITAHNLFEALVRMDPRTYAVQGELASVWQVSKDGHVHTFYLRPGVVWHDGHPFSGEDVKFTFDRLMDEQVRAASSRASLEPFIESYRLAAPDRFEIVCKKVSPFFLLDLSDLSILPAHLMQRGDLNTHPLLRRPVGTGPYRFVSWEPGRQITLSRFDGYWGNRPRIEKIVYRFVTSPEMALKLAQRRELDFLSRVRAAQWVDVVQKDPMLRHEFVVTRNYPPGTSYLMLNHRQPLFVDRRVRRALAKLLDLRSIASQVLRGLGEPVGALYWIKDPDYNQAIKPELFDPAGARRLLAEAGFSDSDGNGVLDRDGRPFRFTFYQVAGSDTQKLWVTMYQQELRKAGIVMDINPIDWSAYVERLRQHDFEAATLSMQQVGPFSDLFYQFHSSQIDDGQNYAAYVNPVADRLLEQIRAEMDPGRRRAMGLQVQQLLHEDMAVIPLFAMEDPGLVARRVHGVYTSALWYQVRDWWIE